MLTRFYCKASARAAALLDRTDDEGQGTLEYIGMVLIAGVLIVLVITAFTNASTSWTTKIGDLITKISGIGG